MALLKAELTVLSIGNLQNSTPIHHMDSEAERKPCSWRYILAEGAELLFSWDMFLSLSRWKSAFYFAGYYKNTIVIPMRLQTIESDDYDDVSVFYLLTSHKFWTQFS